LYRKDFIDKDIIVGLVNNIMITPLYLLSFTVITFIIIAIIVIIQMQFFSPALSK